MPVGSLAPGLLAAATALSVAACGTPTAGGLDAMDGTGRPPMPVATPADPVLPAAAAGRDLGPVTATFRVGGDESFRVELDRPDLVRHARRLLAGDDVGGVLIGAVVREDPGPNAPWSWHLDPDSLDFAFSAVDTCDGTPAEVESGVVASPDYCPGAAELVAVEGLPPAR